MVLGKKIANKVVGLGKKVGSGAIGLGKKTIKIAGAIAAVGGTALQIHSILNTPTNNDEENKKLREDADRINKETIDREEKERVPTPPSIQRETSSSVPSSKPSSKPSSVPPPPTLSKNKPFLEDVKKKKKREADYQKRIKDQQDRLDVAKAGFEVEEAKKIEKRNEAKKKKKLRYKIKGK
tara:strand:+ start:4737 stop:5279 length:543 start_codon:yes stop_codon:yes gene_type:complete